MRARRLALIAVALNALPGVLAVDAQSLAAFEGRWEGTLSPKPSGPRELSRRGTPRNVAVVVIITTASDGTLGGTWATNRKGIAPISEIAAAGSSIRVSVPLWNATFEGEVSADGSTLEGGWLEGRVSSPLRLAKVAPE